MAPNAHGTHHRPRRAMPNFSSHNSLETYSPEQNKWKDTLWCWSDQFGFSRTCVHNVRNVHNARWTMANARSQPHNSTAFPAKPCNAWALHTLIKCIVINSNKNPKLTWSRRCSQDQHEMNAVQFSYIFQTVYMSETITQWPLFRHETVQLRKMPRLARIVEQTEGGKGGARSLFELPKH